MSGAAAGAPAEVVQAYRFALDPTPAQARALASHCGASRVAFNTMLAAVKANLDQRAAERTYNVTADALTASLGWSAYSLRREWNRRKTVAAPWWAQNSKESYATGCANLARALENWSASKQSARPGPAVGFPRFKSKRRATPSCTFTTGAIRVAADRHHVTLPVIGTIKTHESTRKLARRLEAETARITTATIRFERDRWFVSFVTHVQRSLHRLAHVCAGEPVVGVDLGVKDLLVIATPEGREIARIPPPGHLRHAQRKLRALQRKAARQRGPWDCVGQSRRQPSTGWKTTQTEIGKTHARVANLRADHLHKTTTRLAQTHSLIGVETLAVRNMTRHGGARKRGLNRSLTDASFATIARLLDYKTRWYGAQLVRADRFYPSSKTCSTCGAVKTKLTLAERTYICTTCGSAIDRDLNAAINLARLAQASLDETTAGSGSVVTGGADDKPKHSLVRGHETGTPAPPGTATPQGAAA